MSNNTPLFNLDFTAGSTVSDDHAVRVAEAKESLLDLITVENDMPVPSSKTVNELTAIRDAATSILDGLPTPKTMSHSDHVESVTSQISNLLAKPSDYGFHTVSVILMAEGADCHSVGLGYVVATDNHMRTVNTTGSGLFSQQRDILLDAFGNAAKALSNRSDIIGTRSSAITNEGVINAELTLEDIGAAKPAIRPIEASAKKTLSTKRK